MTISPKDALTHFHIELDRIDDLTDEVAIDSIEVDDSLDGQISSYTPPVLATRNLEWPTHADGVELVDGGLENMECTLVSSRYSGDFYAIHGRAVKLTCYNALRSGRETQILKHEITGVVHTVDGGEIAVGGTPPTMTVTMNVEKFIVWYGGETDAHKRVDIDVAARKRVIGGIDQLDGVRAVLGISV